MDLKQNICALLEAQKYPKLGFTYMSKKITYIWITNLFYAIKVSKELMNG